MTPLGYYPIFDILFENLFLSVIHNKLKYWLDFKTLIYNWLLLIVVTIITITIDVFFSVFSLSLESWLDFLSIMEWNHTHIIFRRFLELQNSLTADDFCTFLVYSECLKSRCLKTGFVPKNCRLCGLIFVSEIRTKVQTLKFWKQDSFFTVQNYSDFKHIS